MTPGAQEELLDFLRDIDALLKKDSFDGKVTLYVFGGAAAVIAYGSKRGTLDIDAHIENRAAEEKLLGWAGRGSKLERKHGLYLQSANTELMLLESPDWKKRCVGILAGKLKHLRMKALGKEDLILSKLSRYNDRDREDIKFIIEKTEVDSKKLIAYYKSARLYFVGNLGTLDATFNVVLGEHFDIKPLRLGKP